jgi:hypothetical protein
MSADHFFAPDFFAFSAPSTSWNQVRASWQLAATGYRGRASIAVRYRAEPGNEQAKVFLVKLWVHILRIGILTNSAT